MTTIGYAAMLEQFHPTDLLDWCAAAEATGFEAGFMVSEHFHPWTPQQGQSAFAWSFMGALGQRTSLPFGTAVTCPGFRYHPAVIAHAAATLGAMYPGRFYLGLGAGEALNEHVVGGVWPEIGIRSSMMFESIEIINKLFTGKVVKHKGDFFTLESARLYTIPDEPVKVYVATAGPINAKKAGKFADGMITVGAADEKIRMLWEKCDEGCAEAGKPIGDAEAPADPRVVGADRRGSRPERDDRVAQRRDAVPEAGHQEPRGLRGDGQAGAARGLQEPRPHDQRPRRARRAHPALRGHGLRRDPPPQRRPQPGRVHRGVRQGGPAAASGSAEGTRSQARPIRPRCRSA